MKLRIVKEIKGKDTFFYVETERKGWFGRTYWSSVNSEVLSNNWFDTGLPRRFKSEDAALKAIEEYKSTLKYSIEIVRELEL